MVTELSREDHVGNLMFQPHGSLAARILLMEGDKTPEELAERVADTVRRRGLPETEYRIPPTEMDYLAEQGITQVGEDGRLSLSPTGAELTKDLWVLHLAVTDKLTGEQPQPKYS
jgi:hypothetical protein